MISLSGYYGYGNLGDDMFLLLILEELLSRTTERISILVHDKNRLPEEAIEVIRSNENRILVSYHSRSKLTRYYRLSKSFLRSSIVFGGGTFLYDDVEVQIRNMKVKSILCRLSKILGSRILAFGIGCDSLRSSLGRKYARRILSTIDYIYARDKVSQGNIIELIGDSRSKLELIPDIAYLFYPKIDSLLKQKTGSVTVGLNLASHINNDEIYGWAIQLVRKIQNEGFLVKLIVAQDNENSQESKILGEIEQQHPNISRFVYRRSLMEFFNQISECDIIIASKLHVVIAAHLLNIPCIPLSYQQKVRSIAEEFISADCIFDLPCDSDELVSKTRMIAESSPMNFYRKGAEERYAAIKEAIDSIKW